MFFICQMLLHSIQHLGISGCPKKVMLIMGALFYVNISLFHRSSFVLVKFDLKVGCLLVCPYLQLYVLLFNPGHIPYRLYTVVLFKF